MSFWELEPTCRWWLEKQYIRIFEVMSNRDSSPPLLSSGIAVPAIQQIYMLYVYIYIYNNNNDNNNSNNNNSFTDIHAHTNKQSVGSG